MEALVLDSLVFLRVLPPAAQRLLDLGSGAGFPGIPLAIVRPDLDVTLLESRRRRVSFLAAVVREQGLTNVHLVAGRAESHAAEACGAYDAVVMRCAGPWEAMLKVAVPLVRPGGSVIATAPSEVPDAVRGYLVVVEGTAPGSRRAFLRLVVKQTSP